MANVTLGTGITTNGQFPANGQLYVIELASLQSLGEFDIKAFSYFEDMTVWCVENKQRYIWREEKTPGEENGLLNQSYTYPDTWIVEGIDYSARTFNWFLVSGAGGVFDPDADDAIAMQSTVGSFPAGTTVGSLRSTPNDDILFGILFNAAVASISINKSVALTGVTGQTLEIGTNINLSLTATFNQGLIDSKNDAPDIPLVGPMTQVVLRFNDNTVIETDADPTGNSSVFVINGYVVVGGTNRWNALATHDAGTGSYYDSFGNEGTNLDGSRGAGTQTGYSSIITGAYKRFVYQGAIGGIPTNSADVRALSNNGFLNTTNTGSFTVTVNAGNPYCSIYIPTGKTVSLYNPATNETITIGDQPENQKNAITVKDGGGTDVAFEEHRFYFGATGFPTNTPLNVTITN